MIYPIVKFGNPVLDKPAEKVTVFDEELKKLIEDMFESMYAARGVGLAAPQIGIPRRIAVVDVTFKEDPHAQLVLINPEIIHKEGRHSQSEGCLSIPDFRENVSRAKVVTIRAQDATGKLFERTGDDLPAVDHFDLIWLAIKVVCDPNVSRRVGQIVQVMRHTFGAGIDRRVAR